MYSKKRLWSTRSKSGACYKNFKVPKSVYKDCGIFYSHTPTKIQRQLMNKIQNRKARHLNYCLVYGFE